MSPRHYNLGLRQEAIDDTYTKIISAARELLAAEYCTTFTLEAVAKQADVARMTVYNRFKSKRGLLEALFDHLAVQGQMAQIPSVFGLPNSLAALDRLIAIFGQFWASDRLVIRRIRAMGALDDDIGQALSTREQNRFQLVQAVLNRIALDYGQLLPGSRLEAAKILHALTSFEFFDMMAGSEPSPLAVVPAVQKLARAALGLPG